MSDKNKNVDSISKNKLNNISGGTAKLYKNEYTGKFALCDDDDVWEFNSEAEALKKAGSTNLADNWWRFSKKPKGSGWKLYREIETD